MIRAPGHIVSFFELFSLDQLIFPIYSSMEIQNRTKTLFAILSASRVLGFPIRDTSEVFKECLRNIIIEFVVYALSINYHDVPRHSFTRIFVY